MNSVFIPPKDKFPVNSCSEPCKLPLIPTSLCPPLCEPYTFGPFTAPATVYTYYNYPNQSEDFSLGCNDNCSNKHVNTELKYSVYQIIDGVEFFVGHWTIKDKQGPNKRKFEECGEYILRFCSEPPNECYPDCVHPEVPELHISNCQKQSTTTDVEKITYCNSDTNTQWVKACVFTISPDGEVTESLLYDNDTGMVCGQALPVFDIETFEYCNLETGTLWKKVCRFVTINGETTEDVLSDINLNLPCIDPIVVESNYCIT